MVCPAGYSAESIDQAVEQCPAMQHIEAVAGRAAVEGFFENMRAGEELSNYERSEPDKSADDSGEKKRGTSSLVDDIKNEKKQAVSSNPGTGPANNNVIAEGVSGRKHIPAENKIDLSSYSRDESGESVTNESWSANVQKIPEESHLLTARESKLPVEVVDGPYRRQSTEEDTKESVIAREPMPSLFLMSMPDNLDNNSSGKIAKNVNTLHVSEGRVHKEDTLSEIENSTHLADKYNPETSGAEQLSNRQGVMTEGASRGKVVDSYEHLEETLVVRNKVSMDSVIMDGVKKSKSVYSNAEQDKYAPSQVSADNRVDTGELLLEPGRESGIYVEQSQVMHEEEWQQLAGIYFDAEGVVNAETVETIASDELSAVAGQSEQPVHTLSEEAKLLLGELQEAIGGEPVEMSRLETYDTQLETVETGQNVIGLMGQVDYESDSEAVEAVEPAISGRHDKPDNLAVLEAWEEHGVYVEPVTSLDDIRRSASNQPAEQPLLEFAHLYAADPEDAQTQQVMRAVVRLSAHIGQLPGESAVSQGLRLDNEAAQQLLVVLHLLGYDHPRQAAFCLIERYSEREIMELLQSVALLTRPHYRHEFAKWQQDMAAAKNTDSNDTTISLIGCTVLQALRLWPGSYKQAANN